MAKAMDIADYIIQKSNNILKNNSNIYPISNLSLQKIMYFLNVIHLLKHHTQPLITDHQFEAWEYGPVMSNVYKEYSEYGGNHIVKPVIHLKDIQFGDNGNLHTVYSNPNKPVKLSNNDSKLIDDNIKPFLKIDPLRLVDYSHEEPQWQNRKYYNQPYNNAKSVQFYKDSVNDFWKNN